MTAAALVQQLVAWMQEESAFQSSLALALDGFERALRTANRAALEERVRDLERELQPVDRRAARQREIRLACQRLTGLSGDELTLSRVVEHAALQGVDVEVLERTRRELRERVQALAGRARGLAVLVRHHRGVLGELAALLGPAGSADPESQRGILLDAEA
jgi:hypothetical protein